MCHVQRKQQISATGRVTSGVCLANSVRRMAGTFFLPKNPRPINASIVIPYGTNLQLEAFPQTP